MQTAYFTTLFNRDILAADFFCVRWDSRREYISGRIYHETILCNHSGGSSGTFVDSPCDSKDYSTDFTGLFSITTFDMTEEDVITLEGGEDYEVTDYDDSKLLEFENGNIYRFSKKAKKLDFVKYTDPPIIDSETWEAMVVLTMETWTEKFGEPEFNEKNDSYIWYGNVGGQKASLVILKNSDTMVKLGQCSMMSLERIS